MAKKDFNQLAKSIVDIVSGDSEDPNKGKKMAIEKIPGRAGGLKGGKARAAKLTAGNRSEIAKKAAEKRWGNRT